MGLLLSLLDPFGGMRQHAGMMEPFPNIVYILADDMGYGDVGCLNPDCKFPTPNLDRLGHEGMVFTDAHSSSSVCTPSRYSILTGRYCWRTYLKRSVLLGADSPLIEPGRETVASLLKKAGYNTGCVGKWHVGWDWAVKPDWPGEVDRRNGDATDGQLDWIDYTQPIVNGPTTMGFDYYYGIVASLDMPPLVYVENDRAVEAPTAWGTREEFYREGPRMESLRANNVLPTLTEKAVAHIEQQSADTPFFLYFQLYDMDTDPSEKHNLSADHPEIVQELTELLHAYVVNGRSTPGAVQPNDSLHPEIAWNQINWLPEIPAEYIADD